jgi:hypothetical protein
MALPRKGSRGIIVGGTVYRWHIRGTPTYAQGLCWCPLSYAVEQADAAGTTLVVQTRHPHPSNWIGQPAVAVRPADVADSIRTALAHGWVPDQPGPPFVLDQPSGFVPKP